MTTPLECSSCGIGIGEEFDNREPAGYAGQKPLCWYCSRIMRENGFLQVSDQARMLPNGTLIEYRRNIEQDIEMAESKARRR
jgi:hypothetical protein